MKTLMTPDGTLLLQQAFGFLFLFAGIYALFAHLIRRRFGLPFSPWLALMLITLGIPHILRGQSGFEETGPAFFWLHLGLLAMLLFPVGLWRLMETTLTGGRHPVLRRCAQLQLLMILLLWLPSATGLHPFGPAAQTLGNLALSLQLAAGLLVSLHTLQRRPDTPRGLTLTFLLFCLAGLHDTLTALAGLYNGFQLYPFGATALVLITALNQERLLGQTHRELLRHQHHLEDLVTTRTAALAAATRDAQAASRAKSEFLANMSHELRTPLNTVLGYAALLKREAPPDTEAARRADIIRTSGEHLLQLLTDILDLAKLEAGKSLVTPEPCDLPALARNTADMMRPLAQARRLAFHLHLDPRLPAAYPTDPRRLRQILLNLLGNAFKFTTSGSVTLSLLPQAPHLILQITDTGPGIDPADLDRIFAPFEQAPSAQSPEGTGLGLAISRKLAHQLGGDLRAESRPGHGSRFTLRLPLPATPPASPSPDPPPAAPPLPPAFAPLRDAIHLGDIQAIRHHLHHLQTTHPGHHQLLQSLTRLADACDIRALQQTLPE